MKNFTPTKVIIENPDNLDLARFNLDYIREEAINVKNNSLTKEYEIMISSDVEVIDSDRTKVWYDWRDKVVEISTVIEDGILTMSLSIEAAQD